VSADGHLVAWMLRVWTHDTTLLHWSGKIRRQRHAWGKWIKRYSNVGGV